MSTMAIIGLIVIILGVIFLGEPLYVLIGAVAVFCFSRIPAGTAARPAGTQVAHP